MSNALVPVSSEPVLATSNGGLFAGKWRLQFGRFEVTSTRIIFYKRSSFWMMFGALGMLLSRTTAGKRHLDLELSKITDAVRTKHLMNKNVLEVTMADGAKHRFSVDSFDALVAPLGGKVRVAQA
jgi:hypothetical protein